MDKNIVIGNFSKHVFNYDRHALIQKRCAEKLIPIIKGDSFDHILEVGCGTGTYTELLRNRYRDSAITAVDISEKMVDAARNKVRDKQTCFLVEDGERLQTEQKYDLITSNASLQWFDDIPSALMRFSNMLSDEGMLCFSMYGPETFRELNEVFSSCFGGGKWLTASKFSNKKYVETGLNENFPKFEIIEEYFNVNFASLWDLLVDIKHSGVRGEGIQGDIYLGKEAIAMLENVYMESYGSITATHHVYFCKAKKTGKRWISR